MAYGGAESGYPVSAGEDGGAGGDTCDPKDLTYELEVPRTTPGWVVLLKAYVNFEYGNLSYYGFQGDPPNDIPQADPCVDGWELPITWFLETTLNLNGNEFYAAGLTPGFPGDPTWTPQFIDRAAAEVGGLILPAPVCNLDNPTPIFVQVADAYGNTVIHGPCFLQLTDNMNACDCPPA
jgi:hypothetical protein